MPTVAITVNIYLIFKLSILTLVRFTIWMSLGLIMYFYYGITHSTLDNVQTEDIELTVDQSYLTPPPTAGHQTTAVWDRHGYENKMADDSWSQQSQAKSWNSKSTSKTGNNSSAWGDQASGAAGNQASTASAAPSSVPGGFGIFVDETQFPTWDD